MKRIIVVFMMILATIFVLAAVPVFAEETTAESESVVETVPPTDDTVVDPSIKQEAENMYHTILSNLGEWFYENKEFVSSLGSGIVMVVAYVIVFIKNKGSLAIMVEAVKRMLGKTDSVQTAQKGVVDCVNTLIDSYNTMKADFDALKETDEKRTKMMAAALAEVTTVMEMMQTAYAHNRNVPQSFKDTINVKYAHCMKLVDDDAALSACVGAVKHALDETEHPEGDNGEEV